MIKNESDIPININSIMIKYYMKLITVHLHKYNKYLNVIDFNMLNAPDSISFEI